MDFRSGAANSKRRCNFMGYAKTPALERMYVDEETEAASLAVWTLENINTVCKRDESPASVERLNTD